MGLGDWAGSARVSLTNPSAQAECDRCGCWTHLDRLSKQFQWQGAALVYTGFLVCERCNDLPQEQYKVLILPVDPKPRVNPRPSHDTTAFYFQGAPVPTSPLNQGFTVYELFGADVPESLNTSFKLSVSGFDVLNSTYTLGGTMLPSYAGSYPINKPQVLAAIQEFSGILTPTNI